MRKLKENRKKGFTLVELIVVLVILAILAALLVPALTGYIDKAKQKQVVAETRQCVMAAQTLIDEEYAKATTPNYSTAVTSALIVKLADVPGDVVGNVSVGDGSTNPEDKGHVISLTYKHTSGLQCTYTYTKKDGKMVGTYSDPEPAVAGA